MADTIISVFYTNVKELCRRKHIKMSEIEKKLDVSAGYLSRLYKANNESLTLANAYKIAEILDVDLMSLMRGYVSTPKRIEKVNEEIESLQKELAMLTLENN